VRAEDDAADGGHEEHDRRDLEREQMVGEEQAPDRLGRSERPADVGRLLEEAAGLEADDDADLGEQCRAREHGADGLPGGASRPGRLVGAVAEIGDHEQEHHHHRTAVDQHLSRRDELAGEKQEEHGERGEVPDQCERRVERVAEPDDRERAREARECRPEPDDPDEEVSHATSPRARNGSS